MWRDPVTLALNWEVLTQAQKYKIGVEETFLGLRRTPKMKNYPQVFTVVTADTVFPRLYTDCSGRLYPNTVAKALKMNLRYNNDESVA